MDRNEFSQEEPEEQARLMMQRPRKKTKDEVKIDKEFKRIAEDILRRDRKLLEKLAKI